MVNIAIFLFTTYKKPLEQYIMSTKNNKNIQITEFVAVKFCMHFTKNIFDFII